MRTMLAAFLSLASLSHLYSSPPTLKAPALEKKEVIGLVAPASPIDETSVERAVAYFRREGYGVKLSYGYRDGQGYLAGSDENRAAEFNAMFRDPEVRAVVCLRGGYGSPRILDRIDYDLVRRNPKIIVGYSDITALLNAVHARTGLIVFHGPMGKEFSSQDGLPGFTSKHFWGALRPEKDFFENWGTDPSSDGKSLRTIAKGQAEGVLIGGNLSVFTCTLGTPYEADTEGAILFLEDVNEKLFRIDRMLNQLRLSGKLAKIRGALLCSFTNCPAAPEGDRTLETVFEEYFGGLGVPVLAGFPAGHVQRQATLPVGARVALDATLKKLTLLEAPVSPK